MASLETDSSDRHPAVAAVQCYVASVGVLSRAYPTMVPEFMSYQATIIKYVRGFDELAWAQYNRAYRRQAAQTEDPNAISCVASASATIMLRSTAQE